MLGLGSNVGDRFATLQGALALLAGRLRVVAVSPVFETDPVGGPEQGDYLNAVVLADTGLPPRGLLAVALDVEARHGRLRGVRWGPRTLDVDVVAIGNLTVGAPDLVVPHPRAARRAFVLVPWALADPGAELPGHGRVAELAAGLDTSGLRRRDDLALGPVAGGRR